MLSSSFVPVAVRNLHTTIMRPSRAVAENSRMLSMVFASFACQKASAFVLSSSRCVQFSPSSTEEQIKTLVLVSETVDHLRACRQAGHRGRAGIGQRLVCAAEPIHARP
jgi:hypothetical protein